jgi:hypothetical protein
MLWQDGTHRDTERGPRKICILKLHLASRQDEEPIISLCQRGTRQNYSHVPAALFFDEAHAVP